MPHNLQTAAFGAGCFWGVQSAFDRLFGVKKTIVGYMGGQTLNPTYKQVCSDTTGHAETIQIQFDPNEVSYGQLLELFWSLHDPTTPNRQGPDVGSQYRSVIFYYTPQQKDLAEKSKQAQAGKYSRPIVTQIVAANEFYEAEEYHQKYLQKLGRA
jgi:peptide-methionine (S)-S-oxide reductase